MLRPADMSSIWVLLSKFSSASQVHDDITTTDVFYTIINILSTLIRLRRDLITLTLPHLGMVLRQLMSFMRRPRPHLGPKQIALVRNTQPQWLNATYPINAEGSKALARLLETLTSKTTIRNNMTQGDTQKAESLAKPFSKHAVSIIMSYIEAMNDPLCVVPSEIRKELRPGLFALCGMISDHNRDSLMITITDAGGKSTMKNLWKEYEKQRYVGKG
jgi:hypothetical protein